jgi:hypothetical protein
MYTVLCTRRRPPATIATAQYAKICTQHPIACRRGFQSPIVLDCLYRPDLHSEVQYHAANPHTARLTDDECSKEDHHHPFRRRAQRASHFRLWLNHTFAHPVRDRHSVVASEVGSGVHTQPIWSATARRRSVFRGASSSRPSEMPTTAPDWKPRHPGGALLPLAVPSQPPSAGNPGTG